MIAKEISDMPKALRLLADQITAPDHIRDKQEIAKALGTDPIHDHMKREVEALKREASDWRAEHVTDAQRAYQNGEHE